jgi:hypothetical protein
VGPSRCSKPLAPRAHGFERFFFSRGLAQPALRVLLPLLPTAKRDIAAGSGLWVGCFSCCQKYIPAKEFKIEFQWHFE